MSAINTDQLMMMLRGLQDRNVLFKDHNDLCDTIDTSDLGDVPWQHSSFRYDKELPDSQVPGWMTELYEVYYRDPHDIIKNIIANTTFKHTFNYAPYSLRNLMKMKTDGTRM